MLLVSNVVNWALVWANLAALLFQVEIPSEVWGQYPLILIGALLAGWVFKYWVQNERDWREFFVKQVADKESSNLRTLQLLQANNEQWLKILGDNHNEQVATIEQKHQEQLELQRRGLRDSYDAELERILSTLSVGYYDKRPAPQQPRKKRSDET